MSVYENILWGLILQSPIKRLNIVDGAPVQRKYIDKLVFLGLGPYSVLEILFDKDELATITWYWKSLKVYYPQNVYLFKAPIEQHLRFGKRKSIHYEDWIFGVFECCDMTYRLCPLKRDSDFPTDIYTELDAHLKPILQYPWKISSCFFY